jgi:phosphoribosylamine--glycine ligase
MTPPEVQMQVLVIGSGGREHALAWKIAASPLVTQVWVAPGNPGSRAEPGVSACPVPVSMQALDRWDAWLADHPVTLAVVGPEQPLVDGFADVLRARGIAVVGPGADGAQLEGSKWFCKQVLLEAGVPTARGARVSTPEAVHAFCDGFNGRALVVKADGLAAGKGVVVCDSVEEARAVALQVLTDQPWGADACAHVLLEERLDGPEVSWMVLTDGVRALPLPSSQDHKRLLAGDRGPNTGGMGACSPAPHVDAALGERLQREVIEPTLTTLRARGIDYRGFLYAGLMLTPDGPRVLEYNCRLGDPETQALMLALQGDIVPALLAAARGDLTGQDLPPAVPSAVVVLAAEGYPEAPRKGAALTLPPHASLPAGTRVFHAGTAEDEDGTLRVAGGRVLTVGAWDADDAGAAVLRARALAASLVWPGCQWRDDIGHQVLAPSVG